MVEPTPEDSDETDNSDSGNHDENPRSESGEGRGRRAPWTKVALTVGGLLLVVGGIWMVNLFTMQRPAVRGLPDHPLTPAAIADGAIRVETDSPSDVTADVDGKSVTVLVRDGAAVLRPGELPEGSHRLRVEVPSGALPWTRTLRENFEVDATAPEILLPETVSSESFSDPVTVTGKANGASRVTVAGKQVSLDDSGKFSRELDEAASIVTVKATDRAGNTSSTEVGIEVDHPGMRAVHMTGLAWSSDQLREPVLRMAREGLIDTVELDIKDESGEIQYDSAVPLAERIGADKGYFDARKAIDRLHGMGVRVVGRLVAFKDPVLAESAWKSGNRDRVVRTAAGGPYNGGYGDYSFTNFANPAVRDYNIDIAVEAARLGFDDILYDYVRRPDGERAGMRFAGLEKTPSESIAGFLRKSRERLREHDAYLGASVFGITVTRPESVGQNIPKIAEHVDYVSPMIYPSHWGPGEYGVADPNNEPYKIVDRSLRDWLGTTDGTGSQVIPWLQDFSLGVHYGPGKVSAQIDASKNNGIDSFLLWSPTCDYTAAALSAAP
ncbi:hypothetical protein SAMN04487820_1056 [Actinopolyspora mzabensis]|uniref:DUF4015 domain-containing protein n=1 Tax=Actinopolyspora mzabensis TaxID=995066 RepID=A0A1G8ZLD3_ACTMZ|nr:putative glycoside hydrolase [Actinopolyspora mzabensis]SDK15848.1 hypothetical protein SAMN04487820_1056 [Actinopolyspora mzabensis]